MEHIFVPGYLSSLPKHHSLPHPPARHDNISHMGCIVMSGYILSPPEHSQCAHLDTLVVFSWFSSTSFHADTKMHPIWSTFSCLLLTFPSHFSPFFPLNIKMCPSQQVFMFKWDPPPLTFCSLPLLVIISILGNITR